MILDHQSCQNVTVQAVGPGRFECRGRVDDSLFSAEVVLLIKTPTLEIEDATHRITWSLLPPAEGLADRFAKLKGVRAGQGLTRIVRGVIGGEDGSDRLADLVMDTAEGLILYFTKGPLGSALADMGIPNPYPVGRTLNPKVMGPEHVKMMAAANPRMKDSCVAFREEEPHD
jgi:hypothetical protein